MGLDVLVYQVANAGGILSSATYDGGFGNDDFAFAVASDSLGGIWITGGIMTLGSIDQGGSGKLGLWKYTPGSLQLKASYFNPSLNETTAFDVGTSLAIDASNFIWVVGLSSNPASVGTFAAAKLDLALWRYHFDGTLATGYPAARCVRWSSRPTSRVIGPCSPA